MDQLRKTGTDELLKKELEKGKLMIGESAGAIICAPTIQYIEQMDEKPEDYSPESWRSVGEMIRLTFRAIVNAIDNCQLKMESWKLKMMEMFSIFKGPWSVKHE